MDAKEQADRERRVQELLLDELDQRGLKRPSGDTVDKFEKARKVMRAKLAYMTDLNLSALAEHVAAHAAGPNRDRFPIVNEILRWAADIQQPGDEASPLMRAVFVAKLGKDALRDDWAPELLRWLRKHRRWPKDFDVRSLKGEADNVHAKLEDMRQREERGQFLTEPERNWRDGRNAFVEKCHQLAEIAQAEAEARA